MSAVKGCGSLKNEVAQELQEEIEVKEEEWQQQKAVVQ